jgi:hypothetical protein
MKHGRRQGLPLSDLTSPDGPGWLAVGSWGSNRAKWIDTGPVRGEIHFTSWRGGTGTEGEALTGGRIPRNLRPESGTAPSPGGPREVKKEIHAQGPIHASRILVFLLPLFEMYHDRKCKYKQSNCY